ncbi:hypothetical protein [Streptomyces canus]|uniref:hypothetical protein n=1 Tax=Streptomyces canus TaxID=58343 RepID=UPI00131AB996|nr:hypothetical protein [Streptomyces canus]
MRILSRLELVGETLRAALEELTEAAPAWLTPLIAPEWGRCYGRKVEIRKLPGGKAAVTEGPSRPAGTGRRFSLPPGPLPPRLVCGRCRRARGLLRRRDGHTLPPAHLRFDSPYDTEAHYWVKRDTAWSGCRVHLTEACDEEFPELVVHVATTHSTVTNRVLTLHHKGHDPGPCHARTSKTWSP